MREHFIAVHAGHHDVADNQIGPLRARLFQAVAAIGGCKHAEPLECQQLAQVLAQRRVVFDEENGGHDGNVTAI